MIKLQFKTLSGQLFEMEFPETMKIQEVKEQIAEKRNMVLKSIRLAFNGSMLGKQKEKTLKEISGITENFIVIIGKPKKKKKKKKVVTPAPVVEQKKDEDVKMGEKEPKKTEEKKTEEKKPEPEKKEEEVNPTVKRFMEMGFQKEQIQLCLRAAFGNPDRAAEYLISGIPNSVKMMLQQQQMAQQAQTQQQQTTQQQTTQQQTTQPQTQQTTSQTSNPLSQLLNQQQPQQQQTTQPQTGSTGSSGLMSTLNQYPNFNRMRQAIQQNPGLLRQILGRLQTENPELFKAISENQQEFYNALNQPVSNQQTQGQGRPQAPPGTIFVSQEENEAIKRLTALGFSRLDCAQAYFAFGKNENAAANFLFEQGPSGFQTTSQPTTQPTTTQQTTTQEPKKEEKKEEEKPKEEKKTDTVEESEEDKDLYEDDDDEKKNE